MNVLKMTASTTYNNNNKRNLFIKHLIDPNMTISLQSYLNTMFPFMASFSQSPTSFASYIKLALAKKFTGALIDVDMSLEIFEDQTIGRVHRSFC